MKQNDENKWVEDILNSMDEAGRAYPADSLYQKIERRIEVPFTKGRTIPLSTFSAAAASIVLLVIVNVIALIKDTRWRHQDALSSIVQYYDITNEKNGLGL